MLNEDALMDDEDSGRTMEVEISIPLAPADLKDACSNLCRHFTAVGTETCVGTVVAEVTVVDGD